MKKLMMMMMKNLLLFLLFITVLAPLLLYTDNLGTLFTNSSRNRGFVEENDFTPDLSFKEEKLGDIYLFNSRSSGEIGKFLEGRKPRALSTTEDGNSGQDDNHIRQTTSRRVRFQKQELIKEQEKEDDEINVVDQESENVSSKMGSKIMRESGESSRKGDSVTNTENKTPRRSWLSDSPDSRLRHLKDQLIRAKVYLGLARTKNNGQFIKGLRFRIRELQRAIGDATKDSELPRNAYGKMMAMEQTLAKGRQIQEDCSGVIKKLRSFLYSTEEQLRVHKKQTLFLTQLAAKTLSKGFHCLSLRLSTEYYSLNPSQQQFQNQEKLHDRRLYHYAIFSDNVLASAVVVNSTISHAKEPANHVFHIVTDTLNYAAMRMWFLANPPGKASIEIQNIDEFTWLNSTYNPVLKQLSSRSMIDYYVKTRHVKSDSNLKFRNPKYLSLLNHLRFYLPEIFPKLNKVLFLDDDVVVQKDLSRLWSLSLKGKVNGAVETCRENFHRFNRYLNFSNPIISSKFDPRACGWGYGMNIFDLDEWKKQNITDVYHSWQKLNHNRQLWKLGTLPPGLITFWNHTFPIDSSWHVLGLGYDPDVKKKEIEEAAVIHYNGNMKPWLDMGIPKYKNYWTKFIDYNQVYLRECNINS